MSKKLYAVTGVDHGSIVEAYTAVEAEQIFKLHYHNEKVLVVKEAVLISIREESLG